MSMTKQKKVFSVEMSDLDSGYPLDGLQQKFSRDILSWLVGNPMHPELAKLIAFVADNFEPEDVFSPQALAEWAKRQGGEPK